jgi:hypothetical protein
MSMDNDTRYLYVGSLITSVIGAATLLIGDFSGWYYGNYYAGYREWGWINPFNHIIASPFLLAAIGLLAFCTYISYLGVNGNLSDHYANLGIFAAIGAIGAQIFVFLGFAILNIMDDTEWWVDLGFWGGVIGGALTLGLLYMAQQQRTKTK